jgi:hypothetical protein
MQGEALNVRRRFVFTSASIATAAAWLAPARAFSQGVTNITGMNGDVLVNGRQLAPDGVIQTGDRVQCGPGSSLGFTINRDAFLVRPNTDMVITRGPSLFILGGARLVTGAVLAVFGRSDKPRSVITPAVTAGIRGTGFYVEVRPESTYFCTCFGEIELAASNGQRETVNSSRHQARRILAANTGATAIAQAPFENHNDVELDRLAVMVGQRAPWYQR